MSARKKFTCAALACFLALGGAGGTEAVSAAPDRWTVSIGSLDVMGAADVRVTGRLELDRPHSADLTLEGFVNGTVAVRFVPLEGAAESPQPCGLELTGKVRADDLPRAAITALRCSFEGGPDGVVASLALCLQLIPNETISNNIFWMLFSMNVVFLLISYIPMFPAFSKLRKVDAARPRVFSFPFGGVLQTAMLAIPCAELVLSIVATVFPKDAMGTWSMSGDWTMVMGVVIFIALGEVVRIVSARGREEEFAGLTPELAGRRLAEESATETSRIAGN